MASTLFPLACLALAQLPQSPVVETDVPTRPSTSVESTVPDVGFQPFDPVADGSVTGSSVTGTSATGSQITDRSASPVTRSPMAQSPVAQNPVSQSPVTPGSVTPGSVRGLTDSVTSAPPATVQSGSPARSMPAAAAPSFGTLPRSRFSSDGAASGRYSSGQDHSVVAPATAGGYPDQRMRDSATAPASFRDAVRSDPSAQMRRVAAELAAGCAAKLQSLPDSAQLSGQPVSLQEFLAGSTNRIQAVQAYWDLASAVGDYRFAYEEARFLEALDAPRGSYQETLLNASLAAARARTQESRLEILSLQGKLQNFQLNATQQMPWPADVPLVGPYSTRFDALFANQPRPQRLTQIDRQLPELQKQIELRAQAVVAASQAVDAMADRFVRGQLEIAQLLAMHDALRGQRRDFLQTVRTYNQQIAEYALQVAGPTTPPERLVTTLIPVAGTTTATATARTDDELVPVIRR